MNSHLGRLHRFIVEHNNLDELRTLCFHLRINFDELPGETLSAKARELILLMGRQRRLERLLNILQQTKPDLFAQAGLDTGTTFLEALYAELPTWDPSGPLGPGCRILVAGLTLATLAALMAVVCVSLLQRIVSTDTPTPTPTATDTPTSMPTATDTPTLTTTDTPRPTATDTPMPTATDTPTPTATDTPMPAPTPAIVISRTVTLETCHKRYVTAMDHGRDWVLRAGTEDVGDWEVFTLLCLDNHKVALQTFHNRYVTATNYEQDWVLKAETIVRSTWEEFTPVDPTTNNTRLCQDVFSELEEDGEVKIALQTYHMRYITAMGSDWDWALRAETAKILACEEFIFTPFD